MMTFEDQIKDLKNQFLWQPEVKNPEGLRARGKIILCGMGGSRMASGFIRTVRPDLNIQIWNDYGLPPGYQRDSMVIVSSYSGNTEEAIGNLHSAAEAGLQVAVVASGGRLLELAEGTRTPYIELPKGLISRLAAGYHLKALITLLGENSLRDEVNDFATGFDPAQFEATGKSIAESIKGVPLIYSSARNSSLGEYMKATINEAAKYPCFYDSFPEMPHNELSGIRKGDPFSFILIRDNEDHPRIQLKMGTLEAMLREMGFVVVNLGLTGKAMDKVLKTYTTASWTALHLARRNNVSPEDQSAVEDFKKRIA